MKKIICMIPARLGSKRVPKKNLRYLKDKPLIAYVIESAKKSGVFSEIYINSEADVFSEIAKDYGVSFYKRNPEFSTDRSNNDEFAYDFILNTSGDILIQLLPTSPLITSDEIKDFVNKMVEHNQETFVSVVNHQIACVKGNDSLNFSYDESHRSSQEMQPISSYATVLMGWTYDSFKKNMQEKGFAYHGTKGKVGFYQIKGLSTIDIDNEEDFDLAEAAIECRDMKQHKGVKYYDDENKNLFSEVDVPTILKKDGVDVSNFVDENIFLSNIKEIIEKNGTEKSWCHRVVNTENNSATLIAQLPGEGNRLHFHPEWNEWWYIVQGQWKWEIEGKEYIVKKDDMVFIPKTKWHKITAVGDEIAIRLAVSREDVPHIFKGE